MQAGNLSERVYLQFPQAIIHVELCVTLSLSEGAGGTVLI